MNMKAIGHTFGPFTIDYCERDLILHALAVGAGPRELPFLYERHGPRVLPTFTVPAAFKAACELPRELGIGEKPILHAEHALRLLAPLPPVGQLETHVVLDHVFDKGSAALLAFTCTCRVGAEVVAEHRGSFFVPGEGGFGGDRGPSATRHLPPDREADFEVTETIDPRQGILFRTSLLPDVYMSEMARSLGDPHVDPGLACEFGWPAPLLHGICTLGYLGRAAIHGALGGDPARVIALRARFAGPAVPADSITTRIWTDGSRLVANAAIANGKVVLSDAVVDIAT